MSRHHRLEFPVSQVLEAQINAEREILARTGIANQGQILDDSTPVVFQNTLAAGFAGQPLVVGKFDPFLATLINICEAHNVSGHFARRVISAVLLAGVDTINLQIQDLLARSG